MRGKLHQGSWASVLARYLAPCLARPTIMRTLDLCARHGSDLHSSEK